MNTKFVYFITVMLLMLGFVNQSCKHRSKNDQQTDAPKSKETLEKEKALNVAEEIAVKEYGDVIQKELPLRARLVGDTVWIVEGTLPKGADGGTVYIELRRSDNSLLKITHYK